MEKKPSFDEYIDWFEAKFQINLNDKPANAYRYIVQKLNADFEKSGFWVDLNKNLLNFNDEYYLIHGYPLLKVETLVINIKPYESLVNKSFRKNILLNNNFPESPLYKWVTPANWFIEIKDILRTSITVRYLDGVSFLVDKIATLCQKHNFKFLVDYEAREEGYYAAHITVTGKFKILDDGWNEIEIFFPIEIQITTQLQEVIKNLLHKMYEEVRIAPKSENNIKWQWDYKSHEFSSNYLGHILHYVEGMILEVRDKQKNNIQ